MLIVLKHAEALPRRIAMNQEQLKMEKLRINFLKPIWFRFVRVRDKGGCDNEYSFGLETKPDDPGRRRHFYNGDQKGTGGTVIATYMIYEVEMVTGIVGVFDPENPGNEPTPIESGDVYSDCTWIRVPEGGEVVLKRKLGCGNKIRKGPGEFHLTAPSPNPGGTLYEVLSGWIEITEESGCLDLEHCGVRTDIMQVEPALSGETEDQYTRFTVTVDPILGHNIVRNAEESFSELRLIDYYGESGEETLFIKPGEEQVFEYNLLSLPGAEETIPLDHKEKGFPLILWYLVWAITLIAAFWLGRLSIK
jgi:hypothetical protein